MNFIYLVLWQLQLFLLLFPALLWGQTEAPRSQIFDVDRAAIESAYLDLDVIVTSQERTDWVLDEYALKSILPKVTEVFCQLSTQAKQGLEIDIHKKISLGETKRYWQTLSVNEQKDPSSHFKDLRHEERILLAFNAAKKHEKDCPYWLPIKEDFMGIHRDGGRWQFMAETMGGIQLKQTEQSTLLGGAAQGRLLGVYGIGTAWGLALGIELGGASTFPKDSTGKRSVKAQWATGIPFFIRGWIDNMRADLEISPIARFDDGSFTDGHYGARVAISLGISPLRVFGVLPHIMGWVGAEQFFNQQSTQVYRAGTRIGFSL